MLINISNYHINDLNYKITKKTSIVWVLYYKKASLPLFMSRNDAMM